MTSSYFDNIQDVLTKRVALSQHNIYIAVAWFTNDIIFESLKSALNKKVKVKVVILNDLINRNEFGLDFGVLTKLGADVRFARSDSGTMHNKFCIIDNMVITGSYNWTYHANKNDENILITDEESVVDRYREEFDKLFSAATPIPQPYEHLKWTDVKEGDFSELRRNIFRDVVAKNDHNREVRKAKLIELNNAYKSENQQNIIDASSLPNEEKVTSLYDVLTNDPQRYELKLWKYYYPTQKIEDTSYLFIRKWLFKPNKIDNFVVKGVLAPYGVNDEDAEIKNISIKSKLYAETLTKFIGTNEINDEIYKIIPEELICIDKVNVFLYLFEKPLLKKDRFKDNRESKDYNPIFGLWVLGIVNGGEWELNNTYSTQYAYAIIDSKNVRAEWNTLTFVEGWNPFERGRKIQEKFFSL